MMRKFILSIIAVASVLSGAPVVAQAHSASRATPGHSSLASTLRARLASINLRIEMLRERQALGNEEARELREQSRRLEIRLHGISAREAEDAERAVDRLENEIRLAADDARWGGHAFSGSVDRAYGERDSYERFDPYQSDRHGDYRNFDRYTGSSVDRWHDPFDRGNNF